MTPTATAQAHTHAQGRNIPIGHPPHSDNAMAEDSEIITGIYTITDEKHCLIEITAGFLECPARTESQNFNTNNRFPTQPSV